MYNSYGESDEFLKRVLARSRSYYDRYNDSQLLNIFSEKWLDIHQTVSPIRTDENPGIRIAYRLLDDISEEPEVASATVATIGMQVLEHLELAGYDLSTYEIPIAILIAYLVKSLLAEWRENRLKKSITTC